MSVPTQYKGPFSDEAIFFLSKHSYDRVLIKIRNLKVSTYRGDSKQRLPSWVSRAFCIHRIRGIQACEVYCLGLFVCFPYGRKPRVRSLVEEE